MKGRYHFGKVLLKCIFSLPCYGFIAVKYVQWFEDFKTHTHTHHLVELFLALDFINSNLV